MRAIYIIAVIAMLALVGCAGSGPVEGNETAENATGNESNDSPLGTGYAGRTNIRETTG